MAALPAGYITSAYLRNGLGPFHCPFLLRASVALPASALLMPNANPNAAQAATSRLQEALYAASEEPDQALSRLRDHPLAAVIGRLTNLCHAVTSSLGVWLALEALLRGHSNKEIAQDPALTRHHETMQSLQMTVPHACAQIDEDCRTLEEEAPALRRENLVSPAYDALITAATYVRTLTRLPDRQDSDSNFQVWVRQIRTDYDCLILMWHGNAARGYVGLKEFGLDFARSCDFT